MLSFVENASALQSTKVNPLIHEVKHAHPVNEVNEKWRVNLEEG